MVKEKSNYLLIHLLIMQQPTFIEYVLPGAVLGPIHMCVN